MTTIEELTQKIESGDCVMDWGYGNEPSLKETGDDIYSGPIAYHPISRELYNANRAFFNREGLHDKYFERGETQ